MSEPFKPTYAAIPLRALSDLALSRADLLALAAVSAHDRFAKNRTGCFASYTRLAAMTGLPPQSFRRCVGKLIELGYLRSEANPMDARRRILFVEFTDADAAAMRGDGRSFAKPSRLKLAPVKPAEVCITGATEIPAGEPAREPVEKPKVCSIGATDQGPICSSEKYQAVDSVDRSAMNIFCEAEKRSRETQGALEKEGGAAPPSVMADAERAARDAISGRIDVLEGVDRLRRVIGRLRSYGDAAGERRAAAMVEAVLADAPSREARRAPGPVASPMELKAIREARERGEAVPGWVRPEVRGAA